MIPQCKLVVLVLALSWLEGISSAAYSNVIVQRGPLEYINYNSPTASLASAQLAQLSSAPLEQVVSIPAVSSLVSPCVAPCVIPNRSVPSLTPLTSTANAKIISYGSPLPNILLANEDNSGGYQYAYAVFDEQTGDKKTQSEHSDGSVVQGQYSFIQPDGIRRVVVYTADDLKGFNAVVRNISPEPESHKEETPEVIKEDTVASPLCNEVKNEHLTRNDAIHEDNSEENKKDIELMDNKKSPETTTEIFNEKGEDQHLDEAKPTENNVNIPNAIVSYNDIINCLQAKLQGARNVVSPLTYVLIPSSRSPC